MATAAATGAAFLAGAAAGATGVAGRLAAGAATGGATTGAGLAAPRLKGGGDGGAGMMIGGGVRRAVNGTEGPGLAKEMGGEDPAGRVRGMRRPGCEPWGNATRGGGAVGDLGITIGAFDAGGRPGAFGERHAYWSVHISWRARRKVLAQGAKRTMDLARDGSRHGLLSLWRLWV